MVANDCGGGSVTTLRYPSIRILSLLVVDRAKPLLVVIHICHCQPFEGHQGKSAEELNQEDTDSEDVPDGKLAPPLNRPISRLAKEQYLEQKYDQAGAQE